MGANVLKYEDKLQPGVVFFREPFLRALSKQKYAWSQVSTRITSKFPYFYNPHFNYVHFFHSL